MYDSQQMQVVVIISRELCWIEVGIGVQKSILH